ncbi:2-pyrone-4,6-dicarboxylate hydrolase [Pseudoroseomonas wenyumeiae]|uniref:2-pyrone-4,6-dicarboxylate hydrolase n=1 Tax=Teichococcus wenyumeiae TaxID=2478470 RepID=A0A3A9JMZ1_9PROT|nr:amidohydrolase family protein [Pseudoroseomonas wenyumeiae]RKK05206.1 2-pyrone-4,6-dicarboxylate hydrolase [Pseudoroseomonas wenyumeiae]RMI17591.1 2-pyrone-4,6-dicarboxylate hydrolase [Pseudoroseomonas wenyumeiae]
MPDQQPVSPHWGVFVPPGLSCDAHCHVFGPGDRFPYAESRRYTPEDKPKEVLAALHARLGLGRAVLVQASCHGTDNRAMLDALRSDPTRYRGVAMIDDETPDATLAEMHEAGVRGIRFNFIKALGGGPDLAVVRRAADRVRGLGWHVVLHLQGDGVAEMAPAIRALRMPVVIDHMGRVDPEQGVEGRAFRMLLALLEDERIWVKLSGAERMVPAPFTAALPFARALLRAAPDRVLWGTDFPHPNLAVPVDEAELLDLVPLIAPRPEDRQRLLVTNAATLYGFGD